MPRLYLGVSRAYLTATLSHDNSHISAHRVECRRYLTGLRETPVNYRCIPVYPVYLTIFHRSKKKRKRGNMQLWGGLPAQ